MSNKVDIKPNSKHKVNKNEITIKSKQNNKFNSLTPNKNQGSKDGIIYNDQININKNKVLAPDHNNYHINNNISININIDNNKIKEINIKKNKNKSLVKKSIQIKKEEFKNTNCLIFNTLNNYTNKNNLNKSPSNIRLKSANMGLKELKYNSNNLNKKNNNSNTKKKFNLTTSDFNPKKEDKNNNIKKAIEPKNVSKEKVKINDNNISKNNEKKITISIIVGNLNNEKTLSKNKSNQDKNKFQKNISNKKANYSPLINREFLSGKQNIVLNYSFGKKKSNYFNYKTFANYNKNKSKDNKNKGISSFTNDNSKTLKKKNNSKNNNLNLVNLLSKNQIINTKKNQIINREKGHLNNNKIDSKNSKLNNTGKILTYSFKKDKNRIQDNKNLNIKNKSKNSKSKNELVDDKKRNLQTNNSLAKKENNFNKIDKEEEKNKKELEKKEKKKEDGKKTAKNEVQNIQKEEEKAKNEKEEKENQKKIKEDKQNLAKEEKKKKEEDKKIKEEKQNLKEEGKNKNEEKAKIKEEKNVKEKKEEKPKKENDKKKVLNQSKSQNEIASDFLTKQLNDKKNEEQNKNVKPSEPSIKKILKMDSICKKGFAGPGIEKVNQDNLFIYKNFLDSPDNIFLGVCDGHGMFGHDISSYIVNNLPQNLSSSFLKENLKTISSDKDYEQIKSIISLTFVQTNINLVNDDKIDSSLSGTTCSSLLFCPEKIITANLGDSRCVLGKFNGKKWKAKNITRDQKPTDENEKKRIIDKGGRIEAYKDEEGDFVGPERVWLKSENIPGLAMARSFGDDIAHTVGVISQPEIFEYKLLNEDKFILLASDGIWEFISSDECVNIVKDRKHKKMDNGRRCY